MAKKRANNSSLAGKGSFPGKTAYLEYLKEKLSGKKPMTRKRLTVAREHLRHTAALRDIAAWERISWLKTFSFEHVFSKLPKDIRQISVKELLKPDNESAFLKASKVFNAYLRKHSSFSQLERRNIVDALEKMLVSHPAFEVKKKAIDIIFLHKLPESIPVLRWCSAQKHGFPEELRRQAAEAAEKIRAITASK
jgi:hypothetical protein